MKLSQVKWLSMLLLGVCIVLLLLTWWLDSAILPLLLILDLILFAGSGIFIFFRWRCPVCGAHLPTSGMLGMTHCPYCGNKLD